MEGRIEDTAQDGDNNSRITGLGQASDPIKGCKDIKI